MTSQTDPLEQLVELHLQGHSVDVPDHLKSDFDRAIAAHQALRGVIDETQDLDHQPAFRLPPDVSSQYEIEKELGHGGMGVVYLARQRALDRRVALKVLRPGERTFGPVVKRFLDEARHLAQLRHPNIVSIHEIGDAGGEPYFTMDYIDGESLAAVLKLVEFAPAVSLGRHDYMVAQSLALQARAETPNGAFEPAHGPMAEDVLARRELAARRLALFLDGAEGTAEERAEAQRTLLAIDESLKPVRPTNRWTADEIVQLPEGTADELLSRANDARRSPWDRGKAQVARARILEAANQPAEAVAAYRSALDHFRQVYPYVSGVVSRAQVNRTRGDGTDLMAPECRLTGDVRAAIAKLDPDAAPEVTGGLRIRLDHPERTAGMLIFASISVFDPAISDPNEHLPRNLSTSVPLGRDGQHEVRLMPGRYRLRLASISRSWQPEPGMKPELIDIVARGWPETIEIGDEMIDLPPLQVRQLADIQLLAPTNDGLFDPSDDEFRWTDVERAARYEVTLIQYHDLPSPTSKHFLTVGVQGTSWRPSSAEGRQLVLIDEHWRPGGIAGLHVEAFDESGDRIGISSKDSRFLIDASRSPLADNRRNF